MKKKYKHVPIETLLRQLQLANELLASPIPQKLKSSICIEIENLLFNTGLYRGFNHNFWLKGGCKNWRIAGQPEEWTEKMPFIIGPDGVANKDNDDFVSDIQGEFSRQYFHAPGMNTDSTYLQLEKVQ